MVAPEEPGAYPTENNKWTAAGNGTDYWGFAFLFYCISCKDFTSSEAPWWLPCHHKELPEGQSPANALPCPPLTAVPLVGAVLAVPQPIAPLPVGDALVQLLALELEPAAASRQRWGGGCRIGSCAKQRVRKPTHGTARLPLPAGRTKSCAQVPAPLDGNLLPSSRWMASAGTSLSILSPDCRGPEKQPVCSGCSPPAQSSISLSKDHSENKPSLTFSMGAGVETHAAGLPSMTQCSLRCDTGAGICCSTNWCHT